MCLPLLVDEEFGELIYICVVKIPQPDCCFLALFVFPKDDDKPFFILPADRDDIPVPDEFRHAGLTEFQKIFEDRDLRLPAFDEREDAHPGAKYYHEPCGISQTSGALD